MKLARMGVRIARRSRDAFFHPLHRARALQLIRRLDPIDSVLFVCHGNICRSPYAEHAFRTLLRDLPMTADSAGFIGPDRAADPQGIAMAARRGISLGSHRSKLVSRDNVNTAGLVVVMNRDQRSDIKREFGRSVPVILLGDLDPLPIDSRTIQDPYKKSPGVFVDVFNRMDRCLEVLVAAIHGHKRNVSS